MEPRGSRFLFSLNVVRTIVVFGLRASMKGWDVDVLCCGVGGVGGWVRPGGFGAYCIAGASKWSDPAMLPL